jgi:hypothetical protein
VFSTPARCSSLKKCDSQRSASQNRRKQSSLLSKLKILLTREVFLIFDFVPGAGIGVKYKFATLISTSSPNSWFVTLWSMTHNTRFSIPDETRAGVFLPGHKKIPEGINLCPGRESNVTCSVQVVGGFFASSKNHQATFSIPFDQNKRPSTRLSHLFRCPGRESNPHASISSKGF